MPAPIIVVDDDPAVRGLAAMVLQRAGYIIIQAGDGEEALALMQACSGEVALVLSDIRMPRMDGLELVNIISRQFPGVRTVLMSAYSYDPVPMSKTRFFVPKPFKPALLLETIKVALAEAPRIKPSSAGPRVLRTDRAS